MTSPSTSKCQFCGKALKVETVDTAFGTVACRVEPCDCEQAVERRKMDEEFQRREAKAQARAAYERAGIAPRYMDAETKPYKWRKGLYLHGRVGAGKTYTASAICKQAIDEGAKHVHFTSGSDLLAEIRATFNGDGKESLVYARYGKRCPLLVIDDLGKENPTDFALSVLFNIIDARYVNMLPTIVTTQFAPADLINRLAEKGDYETAQAIVSRLCEMCPRRLLDHPDRRLTK